RPPETRLRGNPGRSGRASAPARALAGRSARYSRRAPGRGRKGAAARAPGRASEVPVQRGRPFGLRARAVVLDRHVQPEREVATEGVALAERDVETAVEFVAHQQLQAR